MVKYGYFVAVLIFTLLCGCKNTIKEFDKKLAERYAKEGFEPQLIEKNDHRIYFWDNEKKDAPVVLFVHGFGGDGKISWNLQAFEFNDDYRVIVPDILWFGESYSNKEPTLETQINALKTLVDELGVTEINIVGISYGGFMSLGYAHKYPEDLKSLTIVDSPGNVISDAEIKDFYGSVNAEDVQDAFIPENAEDVQRLFKFSFYNPPRLPASIREQTIGVYFSKHPEKQAELLTNLPKNRGAIGGKVDIPTLILWGEEDRVFSVDNAYKLQDTLDAELTVFKKAGHALPIDSPDEFNERLRCFLNDLNKVSK